jgi:hypothetical protein
MAQNSFVYDPSASIKEGFKDISTNIGSAFSNIIAQKQQDLALADKVFQNLDAIKEETAAIGSQRINQAIKGLTAAAPNAMFKDGKIDYEGMGKIMSGVSQVKTLKNWWSQVGELKKQALQLGTASVKDMTNFSSYVSQIDPLIAENEGGSLDDLKKKLSSLFDSHLDYTNMAREKVTSLFPADKYVGEMENEKKGITEYSFTGPKGLLEFNKKTLKPELAAPTILTDPATNKPILDANGKPQLVSTLDKVKGALTQGDPAFFDKYRNHFGLSKALVPDDVVAKQVLESFATAPAFKETKSFEKIQTEKNELKTSTVQAENIETITKLKIQEMQASIKSSLERAGYYKSKKEGVGAGGNMPKGAVIPRVTEKDKNGSRHVSLTSPVTITATGSYKYTANWDKKPVNFEVSRITVDAKGRIFAKGSVKTGAMGSKGEVKNIMLSNSDYEDFLSKLGGMSDAERYSNAYTLKNGLGLPNVPPTYLKLPQDSTPDNDWEVQ